MPNPVTYDGEFGDAYAVGTEAPYSFYIYTRQTSGATNNYWFNIGQFPVPSTVPGPQGVQGVTGPQGQRGSLWFYGNVAPIAVPGQQENDKYVNTTNGDYYTFTSSGWVLAGNIIGPQGIQGMQGPAGADGAQGIQGPQGEPGKNGQPFTVGAILTNINQLPTPSLAIQNVAYLIGTAAPYDMYVIVGTTEADLLWTNVGSVSGIEGPTGPQGPQGPKGDTGAQGLQGPIGPQGIQGPIGATGNGVREIKTDHYVTGGDNTLTYLAFTMTDGQVKVIPVYAKNGAAGPQGPTGPQGLTGPKGDPGEGLDYITFEFSDTPPYATFGNTGSKSYTITQAQYNQILSAFTNFTPISVAFQTGATWLELIFTPTKRDQRTAYASSRKFISIYAPEASSARSVYFYELYADYVNSNYVVTISFTYLKPQEAADLTNYYTKEETDNKIEDAISEIPSTDLSNYYTKSQTDNKISEAVGNIPETDLSNYYTKPQVDQKITDAVDAIPGTDLSNYYTKTEVNDIISSQTHIELKVVDALPATGEDNTIYLVKDTTTYKQYIYTEGAWVEIGDTEVDLSDYYTKAQVDAKIDAIPSTDLSNYYTKDQTNTQIQNAIDAIPDPEPTDLSDYYTKEQTDTKIADAVAAIPTTDLSNYYTKEEVDTAIDAATEDMATHDEVTSQLNTELANYATKLELEEAIADIPTVEAPKAVTFGVPDTATQGQLNSGDLATLQASDQNYIIFANELYTLQDKSHEEGFYVYSHVGHDTLNHFNVKCITITLSTQSWVLTTKQLVSITVTENDDDTVDINIEG